jgi:drug/metabolite transporter (DMT)-like permease
MLFLPSLCDLVGTILVTAGMQYLSASMSQMLRGSSLIYVTIAKHFILHSRLRGYQWIGVAFVMAAVAVLGFVADSHDKQHGPESRTSLGMLLTLSGAFACGVQFVIEDKLLHLDEPVSPLILIGIEG